MDDLSQQPVAESETLLYAPLQPWKLGLLVAITGGLYTLIWLYRAGKDAAVMAPERQVAKPVGWLFAGLFSICLPFALPSLFRHFAAAQTPAPEVASSFWGVLGIAACLANLLPSVTQYLGLPTWWDVSMYLVLGLIFARAQQETNQAKASVEASKAEYFSHRTSANRYTLSQWLLLFFVGIPVIAVQCYLFYDDVVLPGEELEASTTFIDEEGRFLFDVPEEGWQVVPIGTYSDGTASLELSGPAEDQHALVFVQDRDSSLDSITRWRQKQEFEDTTSTRCSEQRTLSTDQQQVRAIVECEGRAFGEKAISLFAIHTTDSGLLQFAIWVNGSTYQTEARHPAMKEMAESFAPVEVTP